MTKTFWGAKKGERYPEGSPLGGKFKPGTFELPPLKKEIIPAESLRSVPVKNSYTEYLINDYITSCKKGLKESLAEHPEAKQLALDSGLTEKDIKKIQDSVVNHAADLVKTQALIRPRVLAKIAEYEVAWEDFEEFPASAMVDHNVKQILLNPRIFLNKNSPGTKDGSILDTVTHEMSHIIDLHAGKEEFSITGACKPLHDFLTQYQKKMGNQRWMLDSQLAYPLNGYSGIVQKTQPDYFLSGEYVSAISEMFWHKPKLMDALDNHFKEIGYPGPSMREIGQRIWGIDNNKSGPMDKDVVDTSKYNPLDIGGSKTAATAPWTGQASLESTLGAISF